MNKIMLGSLAFTVLAIGGIVILLRSGGAAISTIATNGAAGVSNSEGKQVIHITAKGGYAPRVTNAKANMPTVIQVATNGTYDCSSSLIVAAAGFRKNLPATGVTSIELPPQKPGTSVKGICGMGMYNFSVNFN